MVAGALSTEWHSGCRMLELNWGSSYYSKPQKSLGTPQVDSFLWFPVIFGAWKTSKFAETSFCRTRCHDLFFLVNLFSLWWCWIRRDSSTLFVNCQWFPSLERGTEHLQRHTSHGPRPNFRTRTRAKPKMFSEVTPGGVGKPKHHIIISGYVCFGEGT